METLRVVPRLAPGICPITDTFAFIGSKWTPLVMVQLFLAGPGGARRYGELLQSLPGISPKTLAERLTALTEKGYATRTVFPDKPPRVEYALTERGRQLSAHLDAIATLAGGGPASSIPPGP